jgi:putative membrane protein
MEMSGGAYAEFSQEELILRDYLAAHRTTLANDRTLLAYVRTTLTFLIGGVSFIQFFDSPFVRGTGWAFLPLALIVLAVGLLRYGRMRSALAEIGGGGHGETSQPGARSARKDQQ